MDNDIRVVNVSLNTADEIPTPTVDGFNPSGSARVVVDKSTGEIEISGTYVGTTSSVVAAHLHGLTEPDPTADVIFELTTTGGTDGSFSGTSVLSAENLQGLLRGRTYINGKRTSAPFRSRG